MGEASCCDSVGNRDTRRSAVYASLFLFTQGVPSFPECDLDEGVQAMSNRFHSLAVVRRKGKVKRNMLIMVVMVVQRIVMG